MLFSYLHVIPQPDLQTLNLVIVDRIVGRAIDIFVAIQRSMWETQADGTDHIKTLPRWGLDGKYQPGLNQFSPGMSLKFMVFLNFDKDDPSAEWLENCTAMIQRCMK